MELLPNQTTMACADCDGLVLVYDISSKAARWKTKFKSEIDVVHHYSNMLLVGEVNKTIHVLDLDTGAEIYSYFQSIVGFIIAIQCSPSLYDIYHLKHLENHGFFVYLHRHNLLDTSIPLTLVLFADRKL